MSVFSGADHLLETDDKGKKAFLTYIIRFDNKGYRVFSFEELLEYFRCAKEIERIIFTLETGESLNTNRQVGVSMELKLDQKDPNNCFLVVTSDDKDWVDSSFLAVKDILDKCKNKNGLARTAWTQLMVQVLGIAAGFFLSLLAAAKLSPKLTIENSFVICFFFALLVFSNIWSYLNKQIIYLIELIFPNLKFNRPNKKGNYWLIQAVVGGIALAITLWALGLVFSYVSNIVSGFIIKSA